MLYIDNHTRSRNYIFAPEPQVPGSPVCTFVGTGLSGLAPLIHGIKTFDFSQMEKQSGIAYYFGEGLY